MWLIWLSCDEAYRFTTLHEAFITGGLGMELVGYYSSPMLLCRIARLPNFKELEDFIVDWMTQCVAVPYRLDNTNGVSCIQT
jgi:hypothetical protein